MYRLTTFVCAQTHYFFIYLLVSIFMFIGETSALSAQITILYGYPQGISVNTPTTVTFKADLDEDSTLIKNSVNLYRCDATGKLITNLGRMYDDYSHGDLVAGDYTFTTQITLNETTSRKIFFRVSAAYIGQRNRVLSGITSIQVMVISNPQQTIQGISQSLRAGNIQNTLSYFKPSESNTRVITVLSSAQRNDLASWFENQVFIEGDDNWRIYHYNYPPGSPVDYDEMQMAKNNLGYWIVIVW